MPPAPLAVDAITGTDAQAGAPGTRAPAPVTPGRGPARPGRCPAVRRGPCPPLPAQTARAAPEWQPVAIVCAALPACYGERPRRILPVEEGTEAAG